MSYWCSRFLSLLRCSKQATYRDSNYWRKFKQAWYWYTLITLTLECSLRCARLCRLWQCWSCVAHSVHSACQQASRISMDGPNPLRHLLYCWECSRFLLPDRFYLSTKTSIWVGQGAEALFPALVDGVRPCVFCCFLCWNSFWMCSRCFLRMHGQWARRLPLMTLQFQ